MASVSSSASSLTPSASVSFAGSAGGPPPAPPPAAGPRPALPPTDGCHFRRASGRLDDLTVVVLTALRADDVRRLRLPAGSVRALHQMRCAGLPLRPACARVGTRHLPLGDGHDSISFYKAHDGRDSVVPIRAQPLGERGPPRG